MLLVVDRPVLMVTFENMTVVVDPDDIVEALVQIANVMDAA